MLHWIPKPIIDSIHIQSLLYLLLWFEVFIYKTCRNTSKDLGHNSRTSFSPCPLEDLKSALESIILNEMSFGPEEELFIDAKGVSMPPPGQAGGTKAFLVDGAQAQPTGAEAFIRRVEAVPMRVMFEHKEGTDQPVDGIDILSHSEIDDVVNYMRMGMHDCVAAKKRRAMVTSPHWWDDKMLVTGKYEKDEFVAMVMDHNMMIWLGRTR